MTRRLLLAVAALVLPAGGAAQAAHCGDVVHAGSAPTVVELYTSQGCNSCPPADKFLRELAASGGDVLPLSFHVDYWDYIGWKDPFGLPGNTNRQRAYARALGLSYIYTPQMVIDGMLQGTGSRKQARRKQIEDARSMARQVQVPVALRPGDSGDVLLSLPACTLPGGEAVDADVNVVYFDREHTTMIERGENRGKKLTYANVVRGMTRVGSWEGAAAELTWNSDELARELGLGAGGADSFAVIVQQAGPGAVLGVGLPDG